ncbi:MAG TPA: polyprenol phosphomannose-dependent alpha 1,6 mannosyltransferase MptB [Actinomycetales bacterium]|nr:polyprenol phosphomannose-dependent alpha 1,6 mannosyltransferase MptB [Actinomycetales bacterium]
MTRPRERSVQGLGFAAAAVAALLLVGSAALGPSAAQPALGPRSAGWRGVLPPYDLGLQPASWVVTVMMDAGYVLGAVAVALGLLAARRGARVPRAALLVAVGFAVLATLVPPTGSGDHLNYAAYGRIEVQGGDPYSVAPAQWDGGRDPVTSAVEDPWTWTPSVYGPAATQLQALTSRFGGDDLRATVWGWQVLCLAAWLVVGALLLRAARRQEPSGADRAAWVWLLNPLLLGLLLVGAHVDLLGTAFALAAVVLTARRPALAGLALGLAIGTKITFVLVAPALLWALWRRHRRTGAPWWPPALAGVVGAVVPLVPLYLQAGGHALDQLVHARRYVSLASPWRPVVDWLNGPFGHDQVRAVAAVVAPVVVVLVAALLVVARRRSLAERPAAGGSHDDGVATTRDAAVMSVLLATAYVLAAPYSLPWYDAVAWAPLGLVAASVLDVVLLVRLVVVAVAYVPGRVLGMSHTVRDVTLGYRSDVAPWLGWALLLAVGWLALRSSRRSS